MVSVLCQFGFRFVGGCLLAASLAGCGLMADSATNAVVAPGKFNHYTCDQLAQVERHLTARERELNELMTRAAQGPIGKIVGEVSYGTELMQARGQLKQRALW
jgi:hypothetical protein